MKRLLSFLKSPLVTHAIALLALLVSLGSFVHSYKVQKFTEDTYIEDKRANIRILLYDTKASTQVIYDHMNDVIKSSDYSLTAEDAISVGHMRDLIQENLEGIEDLDKTLDSVSFAAYPAYLANYESRLEIYKRNNQIISSKFAVFEQEHRKQAKKP